MLELGAPDSMVVAVLLSVVTMLLSSTLVVCSGLFNVVLPPGTSVVSTGAEVSVSKVLGNPVPVKLG